MTSPIIQAQYAYAIDNFLERLDRMTSRPLPVTVMVDMEAEEVTMWDEGGDIRHYFYLPEMEEADGEIMIEVESTMGSPDPCEHQTLHFGFRRLEEVQGLAFCDIRDQIGDRIKQYIDKKYNVLIVDDLTWENEPA